jgi:hypothetical protein
MALADGLGEEVVLYVRNSITHDVASVGTTSLLATINLDGKFTKAHLTPLESVVQIAEQVMRERMVDLPDIIFDKIEVVPLQSGPLIIVSVRSSRLPTTAGIEGVEREIQQRSGDESVRLLARVITPVDISSKGNVLLGRAHFAEQTAPMAQRRRSVETDAKKELERIPNLMVTSIDAVESPDGWTVSAEAVGPRVPRPKEISTIETTLKMKTKQPVSLRVWARVEVIVSEKGYSAAGLTAPPATN